MADRIYFYPVWIRIWHWTNALMFLFLIVTGLSMQYSSPEYPLIRFDMAVSIHNIAGIIVTVAYFVFVLGNLFTGNGKFYNQKLNGLFEELQKQIYYYTIGIFRHESSPFPLSETRKFNPLQKVSYLFAMYSFVPILIISGLGLLFPEIILSRVFGIGGIHLTDLVHIISGFVLSVFMIIHIYFCTIGKTVTSNFKSMFNGWH
jgi:thiosulfate reductase cytochrome b subunit